MNMEYGFDRPQRQQQCVQPHQEVAAAQQLIRFPILPGYYVPHCLLSLFIPSIVTSTVWRHVTEDLVSCVCVCGYRSGVELDVDWLLAFLFSLQVGGKSEDLIRKVDI